MLGSCFIDDGCPSGSYSLAVTAECEARVPDGASFLDDQVLRVGELLFQCDYPILAASDGRLPVAKRRDLVECYIELSRELPPEPVIVELGIYQGGSTVLLSELTHPKKLVAMELTPDPPSALVDYVERSGLADVVRPYYGVDQSDQTRLAEILAAELGGQPIDLVIDDASHRYVETLSSFETLFPHLSPGAVFVIEDWATDHRISDGMVEIIDALPPGRRGPVEEQLRAAEAEQAANPNGPTVPLTQLAFELVTARASSGDVFRELTMTAHWIVVRRGEERLAPGPFRLSDHVHDHHGYTRETRSSEPEPEPRS